MPRVPEKGARKICGGSGAFIGGTGGWSARHLGPNASCPVCGGWKSLNKDSTIRQHNAPPGLEKRQAREEAERWIQEAENKVHGN